MKSKCFIGLAVSLTIGVLVTGCVFIPAPRYASGSRRNVTRQSADTVRCGMDSMKDVVVKFGEPDEISGDGGRFTYVSKRIVGELFVIAHDDDGTELPDVVQYRFLKIFFDSNGIVTNKEFSKELKF
jgi:outer membrane protein assembly factor BamE (lipoprotein component of BamABCDE complex)